MINLIAVLVLFGISAPQAADQAEPASGHRPKQAITGQNLREFLLGRQIGWTELEHVTHTPHSHRYFADGRVEDVGPGAREGTWEVKGDRVCRRYGQVAPYELCDQYYLDGGGQFWVRNRWTAEIGGPAYYEIYVAQITD
jgi:hypothetical protein